MYERMVAENERRWNSVILTSQNVQRVLGHFNVCFLLQLFTFAYRYRDWAKWSTPVDILSWDACIHPPSSVQMNEYSKLNVHD